MAIVGKVKIGLGVSRLSSLDMEPSPGNSCPTTGWILKMEAPLKRRFPNLEINHF